MAKRYLKENLRRFLREVGSVVLGVLIALGIGEVADWARWQVRAANSNRAMDVELARAAGVFEERVAVQPCLDRRLEDLNQIVRRARRTGQLPDIGPIGGPPMRPLQTAAWADAVASGTLLRMGEQRRSQLSINFPLLDRYPGEVGEEASAWATLRFLEGVPGAASDDLLTEAAATIARLQWGSRMNGLNARQIGDELVASGVRPSYFMLFDREGTRAELAELVRKGGRCRPLVVR